MRRDRTGSFPRRPFGDQEKTAWILVAASFVFIAAMTLVPHPELADEVRELSHSCLVCGDLGGQDVLLNILLFVPLGIGLGLTGISRWLALTIAVATTVVVESLQYAVIPGRHASLSDVLTNSTGGWVGITLARHWRALILPDPRRARRQAGLAMIGWLGIQALSGTLLSVAAPQRAYFARWAPKLRGLDQFSGKVIGATLDGVAIPPAPLANSAALRDDLQGGRFALEVVATGAGATDWRTAIVGIYYGEQSEVLALTQFGRDLVFRMRTRAGDLRVLSPGLRLADVLPEAPGRTLRIRAGRNEGWMFLELACDGTEHRRELAISPSWGWSFLIPFDYAFGSEVHGLTALWIGGLLAPGAYWARRGVDTGRGKRRAAMALVAVSFLGLGASPLIARLPAVHWSEWLGAAAGVLVGWCLAAVWRPLASTA